MPIKDLGDLKKAKPKSTKKVTAIINVDFKTKQRTYSVAEHPEYLQDGQFVKKNNTRDIVIDPNDYKCVSAYLMNTVRLCLEDEEPTMFSKSYFDQINNEDER